MNQRKQLRFAWLFFLWRICPQVAWLLLQQPSLALSIANHSPRSDLVLPPPLVFAGENSTGCEAPRCDVCWLTKAPETRVISTINHSYWNYKPTERYRTGASHCKGLSMKVGVLPMKLEILWEIAESTSQIFLVLCSKLGIDAVEMRVPSTSIEASPRTVGKLKASWSVTMRTIGLVLDISGWKEDTFFQPDLASVKGSEL